MTQFTQFQKLLHYSSWRLFEEHIIHKIFDKAIYDMTAIILKEIIIFEPESSDGKIVYSGWNYDNANKVVVDAKNQSLYHPIYIQYENVPGIARGWVDIRETSGKSKEELKHDPIIIHINRTLVKKSDFIYQYGHFALDLNGTVPGLLAHEFTHVRDMWSTEFENLAYTLSNMGHSAFVNDLNLIRKKTKREYMTPKQEEFVTLMLGVMSKFESDARLEAIDKAMSVVPANKIAEIISKYSDEDNKVVWFINEFDMIFGSGILMLSYADDRLYEKLVKHAEDDMQFLYVFMCFMIHYEFISDPKNKIKGLESIDLVYDNPEITYDKHIIRLIVESVSAYHNRFDEYLSDVKSVIRNCIERRRKESPVEFKLFESIPQEKEPSYKCLYYGNYLINVIYENIYKDVYNEDLIFNELFERPQFDDEMLIKKAINEGLTEKPLIWVSRSINI